MDGPEEISKKDKLLDILFDDELTVTFSEACKLAGYKSAPSAIRVQLAKDIIEHSDAFLASHAPETMHALVSILRFPTRAGVSNQLKAIASILDRAGIVKKEQYEIQHVIPDGVMILPPKNKEQ